jgi:hypothetical protein
VKQRQQIPILESSTKQLVESLRSELQRLETQRPPRDELPISSGCAALDHLLPEQGFARGSLVELLGETGSGVGTLAMILARQASLEGGAVVVLDNQRRFYPPAAAALGIDLEQVLVIRAEQPEDQQWALDQCLRCPAVAAVWAPWRDLPEHSFRRLQLATRQGGGLGLLIRPLQMQGRPSWSDLQLLIAPRSGQVEDAGHTRRLHVKITRCRHGTSGGVVELEMDEVAGVIRQPSYRHEPRTLHLAAQLAHPATRRRSARA